MSPPTTPWPPGDGTPLPTGRLRRRNTTGIVGLCMVVAAAVLSPTGFLGLTLCLLVPLGFGGLIVCAVGLAWKPRWPAIAGLAVGLACIGFWLAFFSWVVLSTRGTAASHGMTISEHAQMLMAAHGLSDRAERARAADGSPAPTFDMSATLPEEQTDPWGSTYRYMLVPTDRGYTFFSDGPDRTPATADDIDIFTIQTGRGASTPPYVRRPQGRVSRDPDQPDASSVEEGVAPDAADNPPGD